MFHADIMRIVNVIVDVMLPTKPKDYSIISLETIETGLRTKKLRSEQQHILIQRNLTDRDLTEIKEKSQLLMKLYEHENKTQEIQKKIVSYSATVFIIKVEIVLKRSINQLYCNAIISMMKNVIV